MPGRVEMRGRVLHGRIVAAADMTAREAHAKMDPWASHGEAFLASARRGRRDVLDGAKVRALRGYVHGLFGSEAIDTFNSLGQSSQPCNSTTRTGTEMKRGNRLQQMHPCGRLPQRDRFVSGKVTMA
jgi:hypothetical protein